MKNRKNKNHNRAAILHKKFKIKHRIKKAGMRKARHPKHK